MRKGVSIQNAAQSDAERHRDVTPHWPSVPASIRHLGQEVLQGAYRRHVFKKNMALRFDALADAIAIFTVPDEFDRKRNVVFLRSGYQLLESHPLQDAARQPAAQKPPFPSHDRAPLLHRLHCRVEAGEADGVQENIGTLEQSVKRRAVQPGMKITYSSKFRPYWAKTASSRCRNAS